MSLYAGLIPADSAAAAPQDTDNGPDKHVPGTKSVAAGWNASMQLMAPHLLRKKQNTAPPPQSKPAYTRPPAQATAGSAPVPQPVVAELPQEPFYHTEFSLVPVENEYDPFRPNDYEGFLEEREDSRRKKKDEEEERRRRERDRGRDTGSSARRPEPHPAPAPAPAPAPPSAAPSTAFNVNDTAEEAIARRMRMSGKMPQKPPSPPQQHKSGDYGARLLGQMGWKEGSGLGKAEQGMATPLVMEKTGKKHGVIVPSVSNTLMAKATRVVLLENMVGPGEVDDDLQPEVTEECSKFGKVINCLVFEVPNGQVPDDQAVRIFVQFDKIESARKGLMSLNGRFFGGRKLRAAFFNEARFARFDLAPDL